VQQKTTRKLLTMQILIIIISLLGLLLHAVATQNKNKFSKTDIFILTFLLMGLIVSTLTLIFNFI